MGRACAELDEGCGVDLKVLGTVESDRFEHRIEFSLISSIPAASAKTSRTGCASSSAGCVRQGFEIDEPLQEDYGWGFWLREGPVEKFWLALSYVGEGPTEEPAQWMVSVTHSGFLAFLPGRADMDGVRAIEENINATIDASDDIRWVDRAR